MRSEKLFILQDHMKGEITKLIESFNGQDKKLFHLKLLDQAAHLSPEQLKEELFSSISPTTAYALEALTLYLQEELLSFLDHQTPEVRIKAIHLLDLLGDVRLKRALKKKILLEQNRAVITAIEKTLKKL